MRTRKAAEQLREVLRGATAQRDQHRGVMVNGMTEKPIDTRGFMGSLKSKVSELESAIRRDRINLDMAKEQLLRLKNEMTTSDTPTTGHVMRVSLDHEHLRLIPVCHEAEGAICRVTCKTGQCETYSLDHECGLKPCSCNAVESLLAGDVELACDSSVPVPLRDGMPIEVEWDGACGQWLWYPKDVTG